MPPCFLTCCHHFSLSFDDLLSVFFLTFFNLLSTLLHSECLIMLVLHRMSHFIFLFSDTLWPWWKYKFQKSFISVHLSLKQFIRTVCFFFVFLPSLFHSMDDIFQMNCFAYDGKLDFAYEGKLDAIISSRAARYINILILICADSYIPRTP